MGHGHDHGASGHSQDHAGRGANRKRLTIVLALVTLYMIAEVLGGLIMRDRSRHGPARA